LPLLMRAKTAWKQNFTFALQARQTDGFMHTRRAQLCLISKALVVQVPLPGHACCDIKLKRLVEDDRRSQHK
jgi:hypothetical protein